MSPTTASHLGSRGQTTPSRSTLRTFGSDAATLRKYRSNGVGAVFAENAHFGIGRPSDKHTSGLAEGAGTGSRITTRRPVWRNVRRVADDMAASVDSKSFEAIVISFLSGRLNRFGLCGSS